MVAACLCSRLLVNVRETGEFRIEVSGGIAARSVPYVVGVLDGMIESLRKPADEKKPAVSRVSYLPTAAGLDFISEPLQSVG